MSAADRDMSPLKLLFLKMTLLVSVAVSAISSASLQPALPYISEYFSTTPSAEFLTKMLVVAPAIAIACFSPLVGLLIDKIGRKQVLLTSMIGFTFLGTAGLYLESLTGLLAARVLLGVAQAGISTTLTTLATDYFEGEARAHFLGYFIAFATFSAVLVNIVSGHLADISWRGPYTLFFLGALLVPLIHFVLYEPKRHDSSGQQQAGVAVDKTPSLTLGFIYFLLLFVGGSFGLINTQIPFLLKEIDPGVSGQAIGFCYAGLSLASGTAAMNYGRIQSWLGFKGVYIISFLLATIGLAGFAVAENIKMVGISMILFGIGTGIGLPNASVWVGSIVPVRLRGRLLGGVTTSNYLGMFISPIVAQWVLVSGDLRGPFWGMAAAIFTLMLAIIVWRLMERLKSTA